MSKGRFQTELSEGDLLSRMRRVLKEFDDFEPVSQRAYDEARARAGQAASPRASRLVERFKQPWPRLVELARHEDESYASQAIAASQGAQRREGRGTPMSKQRIIDALQMVAKARGTSCLSKDDYNQTRRSFLQAAKRRHDAPDESDLFPAVSHIEAASKSWAAACKLAGLTAPAQRRLDYESDYTFDLVIEEFAQSYGFLPTKKEAEAYGKKRGIVIVGHHQQSWADWVEMARQRFTTQGRFFPSRLGPSQQPEDWRTWPSEPPDLDPTRRRGRVVRGPSNPLALEDALAAIRRAFELQGGRELTQRDYNDLRRSHPELPAYSTLQRVAKANGQKASDLVAQVRNERTES